MSRSPPPVDPSASPTSMSSKWPWRTMLALVLRPVTAVVVLGHRYHAKVERDARDVRRVALVVVPLETPAKRRCGQRPVDLRRASDDRLTVTRFGASGRRSRAMETPAGRKGKAPPRGPVPCSASARTPLKSPLPGSLSTHRPFEPACERERFISPARWPYSPSVCSPIICGRAARQPADQSGSSTDMALATRGGAAAGGWPAVRRTSSSSSGRAPSAELPGRLKRIDGWHWTAKRLVQLVAQVEQMLRMRHAPEPRRGEASTRARSTSLSHAVAPPPCAASQPAARSGLLALLLAIRAARRRALRGHAAYGLEWKVGPLGTAASHARSSPQRGGHTPQGR